MIKPEMDDRVARLIAAAEAVRDWAVEGAIGMPFWTRSTPP